MQIKIGSFSKRHNSTKQPASTWGATLADVELKEDCSMEEPVFRIGFSNWNPAYNYIYVPSWGRYYFVIDVTVRIGRIWEVACRLDAAATYKSDIQATTAFVLYDTVANSDLIDSRLPIVAPAQVMRNMVTLDPGLSSNTGTLAVSVVGQDSTATYLLSAAQLRDLLNATAFGSYFASQLDPIDDDITGNLLQDVVRSLMEFIKAIKAIFRQLTSGQNLMGCIKSAIWYPWALVGDGSIQEIYLGRMGTGISALPVYNPIEVLDPVTVNIPWQAYDWRRMSPYHHVYLYIPFIGEMELSTSDLVGTTSLTIYTSINKHNGNMNVQVATDRGQIIGIFGASTGVSIPVGASNITPQQVVNSITQAAGAAAGVASGNAGMAASLAAASLLSLSPMPTSVGGGAGGASSGLDLRVICTTVYHNTSVEPNTIAPVIGTPTMAHHSLAQKSGYTQTQDISIQGANMSDAVRQELNKMCDNGIFIE